jgi:hypothetical protein
MIVGDAMAEEPVRISPFVAVYDIRSGGMVIGSVTARLSKRSDGGYDLEQSTVTRGLARFLGPNDLDERSHWRFSEGVILPIEFQSKRKGGDAEDNAKLVFDWANHRVRNVGAPPRWEIPLAVGDLDPLLIQLALRLDLARGKRSFEYSVPRQARAKTYAFAQAGAETIELESRSVETLKIERTNDRDDQLSIWVAPEFEFFAVRIMKERSRGLDTELLLRSLEMHGVEIEF